MAILVAYMIGRSRALWQFRKLLVLVLRKRLGALAERGTAKTVYEVLVESADRSIYNRIGNPIVKACLVVSDANYTVT